MKIMPHGIQCWISSVQAVTISAKAPLPCPCKCNCTAKAMLNIHSVKLPSVDGN